jgi:hypothetical protein
MEDKILLAHGTVAIKWGSNNILFRDVPGLWGNTFVEPVSRSPGIGHLIRYTAPYRTYRE